MKIDSFQDLMFKEDPSQIAYPPVGTEFNNLNLTGFIDKHLTTLIVGAILLLALIMSLCFCRKCKVFK